MPKIDKDEIIRQAIEANSRPGCGRPDAYRCASWARTFYPTVSFLPTAGDFREVIGGTYRAIERQGGIECFARED